MASGTSSSTRCSRGSASVTGRADSRLFYSNGMSPQTIVLTDRLDQLLAPPRSIESDLATILKALHERRFTGKVSLHFSEGVPKIAEFVAPQIKLA